KIKLAKEAISNNNFSILKPKVVTLDALGLGILMEELNPLLIDLLNEIRPGHYAGTYPPQRSYEEEIFRSELFAFRWESKRLGCMTYLKFTLRENRLWLISIHQDRVDPKGR
ncbi:MAG: hypothetical protein NTX30_00975, partial [Deltaproteobacteria bacterium]|nr:hypothetical protein [Deltaproteobacteria bacterium]